MIDVFASMVSQLMNLIPLQHCNPQTLDRSWKRREKVMDLLDIILRCVKEFQLKVRKHFCNRHVNLS